MNVDVESMMTMMNADVKNMIIDTEKSIGKHFYLVCKKITCADDYFHRLNFIVNIQASLA